MNDNSVVRDTKDIKTQKIIRTCRPLPLISSSLKSKSNETRKTFTQSVGHVKPLQVWSINSFFFF